MTQSNNSSIAQAAAGDTPASTLSRQKFDTFIGIHAASAEQARGDRLLVRVEPDGDDQGLHNDRVGPLANTVCRQRLIIVHGDDGLPVEGLLRRVAADVAQLAAQLAAQAAGQPGPVQPALVDPYPTLALLDSGCGLDELRQVLAAEPKPVVIVAEHATRRLTGWSLDELCAAITRHGHYLLLASPAPQNVWQLAVGDHRFWHDVPATRLYSPGYLVDLMLVELRGVEATLDRAVVAWARAERVAIADRLQTPLRVRTFARALRDGRPDTPAAAQLIVDDVASLSMRAALNRWFHAQLDQRGRLIACGLCFFDGLWEETVYQYLSRLLEDVWGQPSAGTLDRVELDQLASFFAFTRNHPPDLAISGRYAGQRRLIFAEALPQLRRHARQALYAAAELLRDSVSQEATPPARFSWAERDGLRRAISAGLVDLGPVDLALLDEPLLLLVADGRPGLRERVGEILGRWFGDAGDRKQFLTLASAWRDEPHARAFIQGLFTSGQLRATASPADCIDAALLMACVYAAPALRPGPVFDELRELLVKLSADPGERTLGLLRTIGLPQLLPLQLKQLSGWLHDLTRFGQLRPTIVAQLVAAIDADPSHDTAVAQIFDGWRQQAEQAPAYQAGAPPDATDSALLTITEVHNALNRIQSLRYPATRDSIGALIGLRLAPRHPVVRQAIEGALLRAGDRDPAFWAELLRSPGDADLARYIELLRESHLDERAQIKGGTAHMQLAGRSYWLTPGAVPLTASKQFIEQALADGRDPQIQQFALRAELALAQDFDLHEEQVIDPQPDALPPPAPGGPVAPPAAPLGPPARRLFFRDLFLPIYVTRGAPYLRPQIEALLPLAATLPPTNDGALEFVTRSWRAGQRSSAREIGPPLAEGVELARLGPVGVRVADYPQAARPLLQALREAGLLAWVIIAAVLSATLLLFLLFGLISWLT